LRVEHLSRPSLHGVSSRLDDLLVVSVATNETDGYRRFVRSLEVYGYNYEVHIVTFSRSFDKTDRLTYVSTLLINHPGARHLRGDLHSCSAHHDLSFRSTGWAKRGQVEI
jgi:hypothetical protein